MSSEPKTYESQLGVIHGNIFFIAPLAFDWDEGEMKLMLNMLMILWHVTHGKDSVYGDF